MSAAIAEFREAMRSAGLQTSEPIIPDGKLRRIQIEGDTSGKKNGWYVFHESEPAAGAFGCWKRGINEKWCSKDRRLDLDREQREEWKRKLAERKRQQAEDEAKVRARAKAKAAADWSRAKPADRQHPYLKAKAVLPHGVRQIGERLQVPVYSPTGELRGLQRISPDGSKLFLVGTEAKGSYFPISGATDSKEVILLAEGFATAATLREATGYPVAVCFSANNLRPAAEALRKKHPESHLLIAADDDRASKGNPGISAAKEAAEKVKGLIAIPEFEPGSDGGDFNDMAKIQGLDAVRKVIHAALRRARGLWPLQELLDEKFPSPKWVIDKILPAGLALLVGAPKGGKSRLATNLALSVGNGGKAMGHYKAHRAGVLYLDLEQSAAKSQKRFKDLLEDYVVPQGVVVAHRWPLIGEGAVRLIYRHLDSHPGVQLVVVDTLAKIWQLGGGKNVGNAYHQEYAVLSRLKQIADERAITVLLIHHESKHDGADKLYKTSGTMAMTGVPDTIWMLTRQRGESTAELFVTGREVHEQTIALHFNPHVGTWEATLDPGDVSSVEEQAAAMEHGVLEFPN